MLQVLQVFSIKYNNNKYTHINGARKASAYGARECNAYKTRGDA